MVNIGNNVFNETTLSAQKKVDSYLVDKNKLHKSISHQQCLLWICTYSNVVGDDAVDRICLSQTLTVDCAMRSFTILSCPPCLNVCLPTMGSA